MENTSIFELTKRNRSVLNGWLRSTMLPQGQVTRARIILSLANGESAEKIAESQHVSRKTVYKWKNRYMEQGIDGLLDQERSGRPTVIDKAVTEKVLRLTTERIPKESTHWSVNLMAEYAQITTWQVRQIWKAANIKPHRLKTFKISNDPKFAEKVIDIVGLYMDPPHNAIILSVDEKTQIQALDRTQPGLPLGPGRIGSYTHDYKRHGTASLYAAFNILTGEVLGQVTNKHRAKEFIAFLNHIYNNAPKRQEIHLILDNYSAHRTTDVMEWLEKHPRVKFHFTPTSASWLNAVEGWFAQLERRALYRGVFSSVKELKEELKRYIDVHNKELAKPFVWTRSAKNIIAAVQRAKNVLPN
jgi:transposase